MRSLYLGPLILFSSFVSQSVFSGDTNPEIEYLLVSVGASNCTFIRNGKEHSAIDAEDHLRMKYRKGKKYINNAEQFIKRIASKSSFSGDPYLIRCSNKNELTDDWLSEKLLKYRESS